MTSKSPSIPMVKGRFLGIAMLVAAQVLVGAIHVFFGAWLLSASAAPLAGVSAFGPDVYSVYTVLFGALTLAFAAGLWLQKRWSWIGTVAVGVFVIVADSLTLLDLPSIPGIPKFAGAGEISYSIIVTVYLLQPHIRKRFAIGYAAKP